MMREEILYILLHYIYMTPCFLDKSFKYKTDDGYILLILNYTYFRLSNMLNAGLCLYDWNNGLIWNVMEQFR